MWKPAALLLSAVASIQLATLTSAASAPFHAVGQDDIDAFMARAIENRDANWIALHDYVLDERETLQLLGPGAVNLYGFEREYTWYIRDGFLIRSPVRYGGVAIDDALRDDYERDWLDDERRRAERARDADSDDDDSDDPDEPRFVSETYFFDFTFEPGNYYFAGREELDGHEVVKIEYYPTRLFTDDEPPDPDDEEAIRERELEGKFEKTSLVTMWVDPAVSQVVKFTFDNVGLDFLPGRWLVRVDEMRASMVMSQPFDGVWLPREITMHGAATSAYGGFEFTYTRAFSDYREAETGARIRSFGPPGE